MCGCCTSFRIWISLATLSTSATSSKPVVDLKVRSHGLCWNLAENCQDDGVSQSVQWEGDWIANNKEPSRDVQIDKVNNTFQRTLPNDNPTEARATILSFSRIFTATCVWFLARSHLQQPPNPSGQATAATTRPPESMKPWKAVAFSPVRMWVPSFTFPKVPSPIVLPRM